MQDMFTSPGFWADSNRRKYCTHFKGVMMLVVVPNRSRDDWMPIDDVLFRITRALVVYSNIYCFAENEAGGMWRADGDHHEITEASKNQKS